MSEDLLPDYRVRLFLSVDLTGSTFFKSKNDSFIWLKAFQEFYSDFPQRYAEKYGKICEAISGLPSHQSEMVPKIWKTIGDEILFVNRVESVTHLGAYVTAFSEALRDFGANLDPQHDLNTKGNGWIAAFPSPNCSIRVRNADGEDPLSGEGDLNTELFEADVDESPERYDFLGKGIDSGFRIARNSTIETFTISPALAYLLVKAKANPDATSFGCDFVFHEAQQFKGVVGNRPYPVISIDTVRTEEERELKKVEAKLLQKPSVVEHNDDLRSYLENYISIHGIEMPCLKLSEAHDAGDLPDHYSEYVSQWTAEKEKADSDLASLSEDVDNGADSEFLSIEDAASELDISP